MWINETGFLVKISIHNLFKMQDSISDQKLFFHSAASSSILDKVHRTHWKIDKVLYSKCGKSYLDATGKTS